MIYEKLGLGSIGDHRRPSPIRLQNKKNVVFHSTSAIIDDVASQQSHMKTEHPRSSAMGSPIIADELRFNENQALAK